MISRRGLGEKGAFSIEGGKTRRVVPQNKVTVRVGVAIGDESLIDINIVLHPSVG